MRPQCPAALALLLWVSASLAGAVRQDDFQGGDENVASHEEARLTEGLDLGLGDDESSDLDDEDSLDLGLNGTSGKGAGCTKLSPANCGQNPLCTVFMKTFERADGKTERLPTCKAKSPKNCKYLTDAHCESVLLGVDSCHHDHACKRCAPDYCSKHKTKQDCRQKVNEGLCVWEHSRKAKSGCLSAEFSSTCEKLGWESHCDGTYHGFEGMGKLCTWEAKQCKPKPVKVVTIRSSCISRKEEYCDVHGDCRWHGPPQIGLCVPKEENVPSENSQTTHYEHKCYKPIKRNPRAASSIRKKVQTESSATAVVPTAGIMLTLLLALL